jgi:hypothetical protein
LRKTEREPEKLALPKTAGARRVSFERVNSAPRVNAVSTIALALWDAKLLVARIVQRPRFIGKPDPLRQFRLIFGCSHERYLYPLDVLLRYKDAPHRARQRGVLLWDKKHPWEFGIARRFDYAKPYRPCLSEQIHINHGPIAIRSVVLNNLEVVLGYAPKSCADPRAKRKGPLKTRGRNSGRTCRSVRQPGALRVLKELAQLCGERLYGFGPSPPHVAAPKRGGNGGTIFSLLIGPLWLRVRAAEGAVMARRV